jgi:hypothetical protein
MDKAREAIMRIISLTRLITEEKLTYKSENKFKQKFVRLFIYVNSYKLEMICINPTLIILS